MSWLGAAASLAELRPTASLTPSRCTRRHDSGCDLCVQACPARAIELVDWSIAIDTDACVGCGLCLPACPVDALGGVGVRPHAVAQRLASGGHTLRCDAAALLEGNISEPHTDVPCVAVVHPETLAAGVIASTGTEDSPATPRASQASARRGIQVSVGPCERCPLGDSERVRHVIDEAREILSASGSQGTIDIVSVTEQESRPQKRWWQRREETRTQRARTVMSRRAVLGLGQTAQQTGQGASTKVPGETLTSDSPRGLLLAATSDAAVPQLRAEPGCTGCEGCVRICPADALAWDGELLTVDPAACVGCGECGRICPEQVLWLDAPQRVREHRELARVPSRRCDRCQDRLQIDEGDVCHRCHTRASLADDVWRNLL